MEFSSIDKIRFKEMLLQTYKVFTEFCNSNEIKYCAAGGTMIGAVRHHSLIPWDDDIDVYMKRSDYDKFISMRSQLEGSDYEILDPNIDGYFCSHAKFSHRKSSIWEFRSIPFVFGVYIDIFVLDLEDGTIEEVVKKRMDFAKKVNLFYLCANHHPFKEIFHHLGSGNLIKAFWYLFQRCILNPCRNLIKKQILKCMSKSNGEWLVAFTGTSGAKDIFRSQWFDSYIPQKFEDTEIFVPCGYDEFLKTMFGDYMTPPPSEKQKSHHALFYYNLDRRITKEEIEQMQIEQLSK